MKQAVFALLLAMALPLFAPVAPAAGDPAKGKQVYMTICIACHNSNPSKDGAVGPALTGSSKALIEARVMKAAYPPGYKPKRSTVIMPPYSYLKANIDDLFVFLNQ